MTGMPRVVRMTSWNLKKILTLLLPWGSLDLLVNIELVNCYSQIGRFLVVESILTVLEFSLIHLPHNMERFSQWKALLTASFTWPCSARNSYSLTQRKTKRYVRTPKTNPTLQTSTTCRYTLYLTTSSRYCGQGLTAVQINKRSLKSLPALFKLYNSKEKK